MQIPQGSQKGPILIASTGQSRPLLNCGVNVCNQMPIIECGREAASGNPGQIVTFQQFGIEYLKVGITQAAGRARNSTGIWLPCVGIRMHIISPVRESGM
jgi:hypothetical protein